MEREGLKDVVYVGDTPSDAQACTDADVPFVWVTYGFGDVKDSDYTIDSLKELPQLFDL